MTRRPIVISMILGMLAMACSTRDTSATDNAAKPPIEASKAKATTPPPVKKNPKTQKYAKPPYYGHWTLDHNAYRLTPAFQSLSPRQKIAATSLLNGLQNDMIITDGLIEKMGRFKGRRVSRKQPFVVTGRQGQVWLIKVSQKGASSQQEWRMSDRHLIIKVNGKDRIYKRKQAVGPSAQKSSPQTHDSR